MTYALTPAGVMVPTQAVPFKPYDDRVGDLSRDFAVAGKFSIYALERMMQDCADQPLWRMRAALCAAYYDGKQLDQVRRQLLTAEGIDERVVNLIRPIVNGVLGQEARSRTDVRLDYDDDAVADVAEVISAKLKEAERETYAHDAVSNAYASMVKKGIGWLHVCRNADPLAYPYRFESVDTDEIWWDWRGLGKRTRLTDRCRWLARMQMVDLDEVQAAMPKHAQVLELSAGGWAGWRAEASGLLGEPDDTGLGSAFDNELRFHSNFHKWDWFDSARRMVKMIEVWYRVPAMATCIEISPSKRVLFNERDPRHMEAVKRGLVKLIKGPTSQVRRALYAGPHRLLDEGTTRKGFPYIPMFAYRDDDDFSPYGMVDGMIAPQDDYNDRRHRIQWMMRARQMTVDNDALDPEFNTIAEIADAVGRPDLVAVLNSNRVNKAGGFKIENTLQLQKEQFNLLEIAEADVQKAAGRYGSNLGDAQVQSGIANSLLIEQGEQAMGEMNDNYVYARRAAFELAVDLIVEDHSKPDMRVTVGQGSERRTVVLNTWVPPTEQDPQTGQMVPVGPPMPQNMVMEADIRTGLGETPNSPAYRAQLQVQLKEIIAGLGANPQALALLAPAYIESSNVPNRMELADDLRTMAGVPKPGDRKGRAAAQKEAARVAAENQQMLKERGIAEIEKLESENGLKKAQTRKTEAEAVALERKNDMGVPEAEAIGAHMQNAATGADQDRLDAQASDDGVDAALDNAKKAVSA